jgi:hypothetical protein
MGKTKLYSISTDETAELKDFFLKSVQDNWDININYRGQVGDGGGNAQTKGWYNIIRGKIELLVDKIKENQGQTIIWADIDIQFFGKCSGLISKAMAGKDIVFQSELNGSKDAINTGFCVIRCSPKTLRLFELVLEFDLEKLPLGDQSAISDIIKTDKIDLSWDVLPRQFWAMSHRTPPPPDIVLHHANWTYPIERDGKMVGSMELKLEQFKMVRRYVLSNKEKKNSEKTI